LQSHFSAANWWLSSQIWLQYFFPSLQTQVQASCAHFFASDIISSSSQIDRTF